MNESDRWERLKTLFDEALALPAEDREHFVNGLDEAFQEELRPLLHALQTNPSFLEEPVPPDTLFRAVETSVQDAPGDRIGPYTLHQLIGAGGMGTVFLAARSDGHFTREVALKLARRGHHGSDLLAHLSHERQILASLQHPNIAQLFDGGVTPDGRPFLAMEYVRGEPIDTYCKRHHLPLTARIDLIRSVCEAVQHAHQNLIIHRDLKPSNILVDAEGRVKLLDFGIAKWLDEAVPTRNTQTGARLMTMEYASPEQVLGRPITTASDVYAIGVLLYEMLAGVHPYDLVGLTPAGVQAAICEREPPRPSTREQVPEHERKRLAGDLDTIVMTALHKSPARRYASPAHLSEDLQRFLRRQPIAARPDTLRYRARTFVRRHRLPVVLTALVLMALIAGIFTTLHLASVAEEARARAEQRFEAVRRLANTLLFDFHDAIRDLPGATPARQLLVANARMYLDSLLQQYEGNPTLTLELAEAHQRVGEIEGDPHFPNLGDLDAATRSYRAAVALLEDRLRAIPDEAPANDRVRQALAVALGRLAVVLSWGGANDDAIAQSSRALSLLKTIPIDAAAWDYGRIQSELGWWFVWAGDTETGLVYLDSAAAIMDEARAPQGDAIAQAIDRWRVDAYRADGLAWSGQSQDALHLLSEVGCPTLVALNHRFPDNPRILSSWRACVHKLGNLFNDAGQPREALSHYQASLHLAELLVRMDSTNIHGHRGVAFVHESLGAVFRAVSRPDSARLHYEQALNIKQRLYSLDTTHAEAGNTLANTHRSLCSFFTQTAQPGPGLPHCEAALKLLRQTTTADPGNRIGREALVMTYVEAARLHRTLADITGDRAGHADMARTYYDHARDELLRLQSEMTGLHVSIDTETIRQEKLAL